MFTIGDKFVKSVGQKRQKPTPVQVPMHWAPLVKCLLQKNTCTIFIIQVYFNILTRLVVRVYRNSNVYNDSPWCGHWQLSIGVCNNYTTYKDHVHLISADGQFFGSEESQHGQLRSPSGICVDSTNTVYVAEENHHVSVYTSSGQFIKCFSTWGSGVERQSWMVLKD